MRPSALSWAALSAGAWKCPAERAPPGYDPKGDAIVSSLQKSGRKGKPEKDPNAPKRPLSAYFIFMGNIPVLREVVLKKEAE